MRPALGMGDCIIFLSKTRIGSITISDDSAIERFVDDLPHMTVCPAVGVDERDFIQFAIDRPVVALTHSSLFGFALTRLDRRLIHGQHTA